MSKCPTCGRCHECGEIRPHEHLQYGGVRYLDVIPQQYAGVLCLKCYRWSNDRNKPCGCEKGA
jgi:hypothetical protein